MTRTRERAIGAQVVCQDESASDSVDPWVGVNLPDDLRACWEHRRPNPLRPQGILGTRLDGLKRCEEADTPKRMAFSSAPPRAARLLAGRLDEDSLGSLPFDAEVRLRRGCLVVALSRHVGPSSDEELAGEASAILRALLAAAKRLEGCR